MEREKRDAVPKRRGTLSGESLVLNWVEENYYLVAYDHNSDKMKHYRVDKMAGIQIVQESRQGEEKAAGLDADKYVKKTFGMSGGKVQTVELGFKDKYAGVGIVLGEMWI